MQTTSERTHRIVLSLEIGLLVAILAFAAFLRLVNLADNPGWYSDEGTHLEIARHYVEGETRYMVFDRSLLLIARMPAFPWLASRVMLLTGAEGADRIVVLRAISALCGVLSVGLLWWVIRATSHHQDRFTPLMAAGLLAIYENAIIYSRFGFSYNLTAPLILLMTWGIWSYLEQPRARWLALVAVTIGLSIYIDLLLLNLLGILLIVIAVRRWRDALWALPLALLPLALYVALHLLTDPDIFLYDARFTLGRMGGKSIWVQVAMVLINHVALIKVDPWVELATLGLFVIPFARQQRVVILVLLFSLFSLERSIGVSNLGRYYLIPYMPLIAWGVASLVRYFVPRMIDILSHLLHDVFDGWTWWPQTGRWYQVRVRLVALVTVWVVVILMLTPYFYLVVTTIFQTLRGYDTKINTVLVDADEARTVAAILNVQIQPDDVVLASPAMAWLLEGQVADFQMAVAATGEETAHLPDDIPADRFLFDPSYTHADYVVVDSIWRNWAALNMEDVETMLDNIEANWWLTIQDGDITVYENPDRLPDSRNQTKTNLLGVRLITRQFRF